jgi:lipopolysaccharide/colanic/teichoic acid biosynthesis glycosyltransferase
VDVMPRQTGWRLLAKQLFDRSAAAVGLVAVAPVLGVTTVAIRATLGSPVLFRQVRPGLGGRPFELIKFRTMRDGPEPDAERLTAFGRFLRASSLDELPQLINVVRGELSLVGPRPLLTRYLPRYSPAQARRHDVLPGMTGWAQINGRNALSWPEKFALDTWYVDHWSLALDAKILLLTARRVLQRSGVAQAGHATMPEFMGEAPQP